METRHTPGPWRWMAETLVAGEGGKHLLYAEEAPGLGKAAGPNAALIAAAPELLTALSALVERMERTGRDTANTLDLALVGRARAAIAKATSIAA